MPSLLVRPQADFIKMFGFVRSCATSISSQLSKFRSNLRHHLPIFQFFIWPAPYLLVLFGEKWFKNNEEKRSKYLRLRSWNPGNIWCIVFFNLTRLIICQTFRLESLLDFCKCHLKFPFLFQVFPTELQPPNKYLYAAACLNFCISWSFDHPLNCLSVRTWMGFLSRWRPGVKATGCTPAPTRQPPLSNTPWPSPGAESASLTVLSG